MPSVVADGQRACIYVAAGPNGAGKSSIVGATIRQSGADYFNPDEETRRLRIAQPQFTEAQANGAAWNEGRRLLEEAIAARRRFAFETTLGGATITRLLERALDEGLEVRMWFVALTSPELHIARVSARVLRGGHDIPEQKIRERYDRSRQNLIRLLPRLTELRVYDNSAEGNAAAGVPPAPLLVLHMANGRVVKMCAPADVPDWAKPIVAVAFGPSR